MEAFSDNALLRRLAFDNPWWDGADIDALSVQNRPERVCFQDFADRVDGLNGGKSLVLVGPRGVGKSDFLQRFAVRLLERGTAPSRILRASLTAPSLAGHGLRDLISLFSARFGHKKNASLYVLVDEPVYGGDWQKDLKALAKNWPHSKFIMAVSAGAPALVSGKADPVSGADVFVLPPLTFLEFLRFRGSETKLFGPGADKAQGRAIYQDRTITALNKEFLRYVNFGGYPKALAAGRDEQSARNVPLAIRDTLADLQLHRDLAGLFGVSDIQELNRLFALIAFNTGLETSMEELANHTGIAKNTVRKYLDFLEGAFLIRRLRRVDKDAKPFQRQVLFKVILTNPSLYISLFGPVSVEDEAFERLCLTTVAAQWLGRDDMGDLAYASWRGGAVDLLILDPKSSKPRVVYQVDWDGNFVPDGKGPKKMNTFIKNNKGDITAHVLSRNLSLPAVMKGTKMSLVPAAYYAYWLGRGEEV